MNADKTKGKAQSDADGNATALTLRQAGNTTVAKRLDDAPAGKQQMAIKVDPAIFDQNGQDIPANRIE